MAAQESALQDKRREVTELRTSIKEIEHTTVGLRQRLKKLEHESTSGTADASLIAAYSHEMRNIKRNVSQAEDAGIKRLSRAELLDTEIEEMSARLGEELAAFEGFKQNIAAETETATQKLGELQSGREPARPRGSPRRIWTCTRGSCVRVRAKRSPSCETASAGGLLRQPAEEHRRAARARDGTRAVPLLRQDPLQHLRC